MRRLFLEPSRLAGDRIVIDGPDHHHLVNVLRVRPDETLMLLDGEGAGWYARVHDVDRRSLTVRLHGAADVAPEPSPEVVVAQAIGKGDRFEEALEHATEAGACGFIPLLTERTVVRLQAGEDGARLARWRAIVKCAAEQAGRCRVPPVHPIARLDSVMAATPTYRAAFPLQPDAADGLGASCARRAALCGRVLLLVGPEGGFSPAEVARAREAGARPVSLGPHVLRTETAALVAVSQIRFAARLAEGQVGT